MTPRKQRMFFVGVVLVGVAAAAALAISAFSENMLYFFSPTQVKAGEAPPGRNLRVGGIVVDGSVRRQKDGLTVSFDLTDTAETITVTYTGILPDLFREGQGIVAMGKLTPTGVLAAGEVLAKHDENYMPPEVAEAVEAAKKGGSMKMPHK